VTKSSEEDSETTNVVFILFPVFRKSLFGSTRQHAYIIGTISRVSKDRRCAHTSKNGDGGMVDNIMMASAGRGGAGLRGDQYYPPPPPFPRPCVSLTLSLSFARCISVPPHPRLTFPQTPPRVSPPTRPPSPLPPHECQVPLPSISCHSLLLRLVLRFLSLSSFFIS